MFQLFATLLYFTAFGAVSGILLAIIPGKFFEIFPYEPYKFEKNGKIYNKYLKINLWKDKLPQFSSVTRIGFDKRSIGGLTPESLRIFLKETVRAEVTHWILLLSSPVYFHLKTNVYTWMAIVMSVLGNIPFILIQRYNRGRILKVTEQMRKRYQRVQLIEK